MNFAELKKIIDGMARMIDNAKVSSFSDVEVKFKTFDEKFDENADEYQEPDTITAVEVDILTHKKFTITIERKVPNERMEALHNVIDT